MWINLKSRLPNGVEIIITQLNIPDFAFNHDVIIYGTNLYVHASNADYFSCSAFDATHCKATENMTISK